MKNNGSTDEQESVVMANNGSHLLGKGYVQVYTGDCKGKTTAALGLSFRAMGRGLRTYIGQFMKDQHCGELAAAKMVYPHITIEQYCRNNFNLVQNISQRYDAEKIREGISKVKQAMLSGKYDIVICDEIITAHSVNLVSLEDMLEIVADKPDGVEIVFTGRHAPPELILVADLVTEMVEVKHYYRKGVTARDGIEH